MKKRYTVYIYMGGEGYIFNETIFSILFTSFSETLREGRLEKLDWLQHRIRTISKILSKSHSELNGADNCNTCTKHWNTNVHESYLYKAVVYILFFGFIVPFEYFLIKKKRQWF